MPIISVSLIALSKTTSPTLMFGLSSVHFPQCSSGTRYSLFQDFQKVSARHCTCFHCFVGKSVVEKLPIGTVNVFVFWAGVRTVGTSGSLETGTSGLAFITANFCHECTQNFMCKSSVCRLEKYCIQDASGNTNESFPWAAHVWRSFCLEGNWSALHYCDEFLTLWRHPQNWFPCQSEEALQDHGQR